MFSFLKIICFQPFLPPFFHPLVVPKAPNLKGMIVQTHAHDAENGGFCCVNYCFFWGK
jgi:hypothetical protein